MNNLYSNPANYERQHIPVVDGIFLEDNHLFSRTPTTISYGKINFCFYYIPARTGQQDPTSKDILDFKNKNIDTVDRFANIIQNKVIRTLNKYRSRYVLCCVPPHNTSSINNNACAMMIDIICNKPANRNLAINGKYIITRIRDIPSSHIDNSSRSTTKQFSTITINNKELIRNKTVLLMDDIYTTGSSMLACGIALLRSGAGSVIYLSIGRTTQDGKHR